MRMRPPRLHRRGIKSLAAVATCGVALAVGPGLVLSPASAAGILPTTTTLTSSASSITQGQEVTLTATIKILGILPGLIITPKGTVDFSTGLTSLGSAPIGSCPLKTCTASITTDQLPVGNDTVLAGYEGDTLSAGSPGTVTVNVTAIQGTPENPEITNCPNGGTCDTGPVTGASDDSSIDTTAPGDGETLTSSVGGDPLPCSVTGAGDIASIDESAGGPAKTVTYTQTGSAADTMYQWENSDADGTDPWVCWDADTPFSAWYNAAGGFPQNTFTSPSLRFGTVPQVESGPWAGTYAGLLALCGETFGGVDSDPIVVGPPCYESHDYTLSSDNEHAVKLVTVIDAPAGDPRTGGG